MSGYCHICSVPYEHEHVCPPSPPAPDKDTLIATLRAALLEACSLLSEADKDSWFERIYEWRQLAEEKS